MESYAKKQYKIKLDGREFPLAFPMKAYREIVNCIDGFDFGEVNKMMTDPNKMMQTFYILAKYGAIMNGQEVDFDQDWIDLHTPVSTRKILAIQLAIINTINANMEMESAEDDDLEREVDLVLQEIQKKSKVTSSHGEKSQPGG